MAGVTLSRTAALVPCASQQQHGAHRSDASENCNKLRLRAFEGLQESQKGVFVEKKKTMSLNNAVAAVPLKRAGGGGALCAHMVAVPATATRGADIEFSSDVFKKEKVGLAGRDEVGHAGLVVFGCLSTGDRGCKF